jgi:hypothetical protein
MHLVAFSPMIHNVKDSEAARAKAAKQNNYPNDQSGYLPSTDIFRNAALVFDIGDAAGAVRKGCRWTRAEAYVICVR